MNLTWTENGVLVNVGVLQLQPPSGVLFARSFGSFVRNCSVDIEILLSMHSENSESKLAGVAELSKLKAHKMSSVPSQCSSPVPFCILYEA